MINFLSLSRPTLVYPPDLFCGVMGSRLCGPSVLGVRLSPTGLMCSDSAVAILMSVSPQMTSIRTQCYVHNNVTLSGTLDSHLRVGDEKARAL